MFHNFRNNKNLNCFQAFNFLLLTIVNWHFHVKLKANPQSTNPSNPSPSNSPSNTHLKNSPVSPLPHFWVEDSFFSQADSPSVEWSVPVVSLHARPAQSLSHVWSWWGSSSRRMLWIPWIVPMYHCHQTHLGIVRDPVKEGASHALPEGVYTPYLREKIKRKAIIFLKSA